MKTSESKEKKMSGINLLNKTCNKSSFMYKSFDDIEQGVYEVKFFEPLTTKYGKRIGASLADGKCYRRRRR